MAKRRPTRTRGEQTAESSAAVTEKLLGRVNRELYKRNAELAVRNKTLALLRKLDEIAMSTLGIEDMTQEIATAISTELGFEFVAVVMVDRDENLCRWFGASSTIPAYASVLKGFPPRSLAVPLDARDNVCVRVLRRRTPELAGDLAAVLPAALVRELRRADGRRGPQLRSSLVSPLRLGPRVLGALAVSATRDLKELTHYEREALAGIVGLVAIALEKARIYRDLQETTADLRVANAQLAQLDKAKSEFLSIASHQLYTPLTALKGYLSMLQEGNFGTVPQKQRGIVDILRASSDRLIDLIRNLLDISRIESGRLELAPEAVDLVGMTQELVTELTPNARRKQLTLTFHAPTARLPRAVADAQRIRQVLLNCLDNAIKYTDAGQVDVRVQRGGDHLIYAVQDTGKGISASDLRRLFGKFVRVGNAERYHTEGTGLGLYVARQIVREHRGDIWAESQGPGKGATFYVKLPIEGTPQALKAGTKLVVGIKAGEAGQRPDGSSGEVPPARGTKSEASAKPGEKAR